MKKKNEKIKKFNIIHENKNKNKKLIDGQGSFPTTIVTNWHIFTGCLLCASTVQAMDKSVINTPNMDPTLQELRF